MTVLSWLRPRPAQGGRPSRADVFRAYRELLKREPESEATIAFALSYPSVADLYLAIAQSSEYIGRVRPEPFSQFNSSIDVEGIIRSHEAPGQAPVPGHVVNFLGVKMDARFMPVPEHFAGTVMGVPIPANFHADMSEWGAALRAVDLAKGSFTVLELGCGWGCWMINTATAARRRGLKVHAIGVEGDSAHLGFAREALATNGFAPGESTLMQGVVAAAPGTALFPKPDRQGRDYGSEPIFGLQGPALDGALRTGRYDQVEVISLEDAMRAPARVDLLHIDIQGGEADLVRDTLPLLRQKVAYMVIGTHSRIIEGRIFEHLAGGDWKLEVERPALLELRDTGPYTRVDGVQGWRNTRLAPAAG
jgi:FkbM family methyltransferase